MSVWGQCLGLSSCLLSMSTLLLGVSVFSHHVDLLLKVLDSWTWWWHLFYILFLPITPSLSLMLDFGITSWASHYRFSLSLHFVYHRCSFRFGVPWKAHLFFRYHEDFTPFFRFGSGRRIQQHPPLVLHHPGLLHLHPLLPLPVICL